MGRVSEIQLAAHRDRDLSDLGDFAQVLPALIHDSVTLSCVHRALAQAIDTDRPIEVDAREGHYLVDSDQDTVVVVATPPRTSAKCAP
jgi:hypothetical protein